MTYRRMAVNCRCFIQGAQVDLIIHIECRSPSSGADRGENFFYVILGCAMQQYIIDKRVEDCSI